MRRTKSATLVVAAVLFSFLLAAGTASAQEPAAVIEAKDVPGPIFEPANVTVDVGDTVRWEFDEADPTIPHNVKSSSENWEGEVDSPIVADGPPVEYTFTAPGTYTFLCEVHPGMNGSVTVVGDEPADELENVLLFSKTSATTFRHPSIDEGIAAIEQLGANNDFNVDATEDSTVFNDANLALYDAIVFLSTTGDILDGEQQAAFERYIQSGGGFVGIHAASDTEYTWPWYGEMLGGYFRNHPPGTPQANVDIEDAAHPSTAGLDNPWTRTDEWYNFQSPEDPVVGGNQAGIPDYSPRNSGVHVLATVDESTYDEQDESAEADDHPIAWCSDFDGGRVWYTAGGHTEASFTSEPDFMAHILGGLEWASGAVAGDCGEPRQATPTANDFEKVTLDDDTSNPFELDIAEDGRVFYIERNGELRIWSPVTEQTVVAGTIPVYTGEENGLMGLQLAPDFETSGWVYLTYSALPESSLEQRVSRFKVNGNSLDLESEEVIFSWQHQRETCCHSSGSLAFDSAGNLYVSIGDNTNPFASHGFAPIDERVGIRNEVGEFDEYNGLNYSSFDAQRTSANTNNLNGKIVRVKPMDTITGPPGVGTTYTIPDGNLFPEADDTTNQTRPEIFAMGFRNPFRITIDPKTDWVLMGDYGPDAGQTDPNRGPQGSVEYNTVTEAGNYGWPYCVRDNTPYNDYNFATGLSGPKFDCADLTNDSPHNDGLADLPPAIGADAWMGYTETDPRHPDLGTGGAPTGGPRYDFDPDNPSETKFPAFYDGLWFNGEWNNGWIKTFALDEQGAVTDVELFPYLGVEGCTPNATQPNSCYKRPMDMEFGPDGSLYLIEWGSGFGGNNTNSGIYRIDYIKGNRRPIATATATPTSGPTPLDVQFSAEGSIDPEGTSLTYAWDFDNDGTVDSTDFDPTYTYADPGTYTASLTVTDGDGDTGVDNVQIIAGNTAPEVTVTIPEEGQFAGFGELIPYEITVTDAEDGSTADGTIDCDEVILNVSLGHDEHAHELAESQGCSGTFVPGGAAGHGSTANVFPVIEAVYTDEGGEAGAGPITGNDVVVLQPKLKQAEFFTSTGRTEDANGGGDPGVQTEDTADEGGGLNIGFTEDGDYVSYAPMNFKDIRELVLRVASGGAGGTIELRLDAPDGELLATSPTIANTGGWQNWVDVTVPISDPGGTHELFLVFRHPDSTGGLMNLNWIRAVGKGAAVSESPQVSASADPDSGESPLTVQFTGEATDPDAVEGDELTYAWDFGVAGTTEDTSTEQNPTYTYERAGRYNATFTATDPHGARATATVEVLVTAPPGECPQNNVRSDEFEGDSLDTNRWTIVRPDDTRPPTVSDGVLHFPIDNGSLYQGGTSARNIIVQPLPDGDVEVTAKISTEPLTENYQQAGLRVYSDDDNWASVHMIHASGARDFEFIYENAGNPRNGPEDKAGGIAADAPHDYWVRIVSDGSTLTAAYSWDGETFETVGQPADISGWTNPRIGPVALSDQAATYPVADFDWIRFDPDATGGGGGGGGGGGETELFADEFDGSTLGSGWSVIRQDQSLTVEGGTLNIPAQTGDIYGASDTAKNLVVRDAPDGEWTATAKVNFTGTEQYHQAGMLVYGDDANFTKLGRLITNAAGSAHAEKFEFIYENAGTPRNEPADSTANLPAGFPADYWVRITSDGASITGAYSIDGEDWTPVGRPAPLPADARIGLFAFSNNGAGNPVAAFDSMRITAPGGGGPAGPSFDDDFDGSELDKDRWNAIVREDDTSYEVAGGELTITTQPGDIYGGDNTNPSNFIFQDSSHAGEDWTIETKLSTTLNGGWGQGGLMAYLDDGNYVKWDAIADNEGTRLNRLELRSEIDEAVQGGAPADPQVPEGVTTVWLRLTKTGDEYLGEYSFDGETWAATATPVTNPMESPDFGLFAFGPQPDGQGDTVSFDYFLLDGRDPGGDPCECVPGPGDEFDGTSLDAGKWNAIVREDPTQYTVQDGALRVTTVGGDIYQDGNPATTRNFILQDAPAGDWVIETKVGGDLSGGYEQAGLMVYEDDDNYIKYDLISDDGQTIKNRIELRSEVDGAIQQPTPEVTTPAPGYDAVWLRLTKTGTSYAGEYSLDGETWTSVGQPVSNDMEAPRFGLFTLGVDSPGGTAVFDYFAVNGSRGCPGEEPDNTAPVIDSVTATPSSGFAPLDVDFAVEATDADEDELTYSWNFGDGGTSDEQNPTHTYTEPGEYEAEVTVSDGEAERSRTVDVNVLDDEDEGRFRVLVFSKTAGFRHSSIDEGHAAIEALGDEHDFQVDHTEDATLFRDAVLERYEAVIWLSTTGDVLNDDQQAAFERYIEGGGGYTGIHAAADTEYDWKWYGNLVGAYFESHPQNQTATVDVEDLDDPSTAHLDPEWERFDEWYNYKPVNFEETGDVDYSPRADVHVLASLDESTYDEGDGSEAADDHPISWCQRYEGGRSWYTGMGHTEESFTEDEDFLGHILGGIEVAAGVVESEECGVQTGGPGAPTVEGFANPTMGSAPLQVRFSATGLDPDGGRITYMWEFGDGTRSFSRSPRHTYTTPGEYTATVTATDREGKVGTDTVEITVGDNQAPTVQATADVTEGDAPLRVRFRSTGMDPDGPNRRLTYEWDFGDEGRAFGRNAVHRYMEPGTYTATVTVTDATGKTATDEIEITVTNPPGNMAPNVEAAADPASGSAPLRVRFTSQGTDPDGDRLTYAWDFGDDSEGSDRRNATHTYTEVGSYTATVTVTDPAGLSASEEIDIEVTNAAPTVRAAADPSSGTAPLRVRFSAAGRDADGDRLSYVWDFGNGVKAGGARATYTYTQPGTYTATVTVRDAKGATGSASVPVTVTGPQGSPPPAGDGDPVGDGDVAGESVVSLKLAKNRKVRRVARRGLRYTVGCETACRVTAKLRLTKKLARKLGLPKKARALGKAKARRIAAGGSRKIVVKLDRKLRRNLARAMKQAGMKRLRTVLVTKVRTEDGGKETVRRRVNLKR